MLKLCCPVQKYAWGKLGENSLVAILKSSGDSSFQLNSSLPYAELWMGTHTSGPAIIDGTNTYLSNWLSLNSSAVGYIPDGYSSDSLPFLLKVLSVRTALSIQAHPDKTLAKTLHITQPEHYKDSNHKPEMSIALTPFESMCGFRPISEIRNHLTLYPELKSIIGNNVSEQFQTFDLNDSVYAHQQLKSLFTALMEASDDNITENLQLLIHRLKSQEQTKFEEGEETHSNEIIKLNSLMLRLYSDYPNDRGVVCPLILNYLEIKPGQAFFMGPNEPHAYISGDCVECMALSDNTVRAGLTPKHRDVTTLCEMLHYKSDGPPICPIQQLDEYTTLFRPPFDICAEFEVEKIELLSGQLTSFLRVPCASIFILVSGTCNLLVQIDSSSSYIEYPHSIKEDIASTGSIYFLSANQSAIITTDTGVVIYRAHVNLELLENSQIQLNSFEVR
mmetsp:Transcript_2467/g.2427  ORF Transcript_2467/g.2427 Transcript_2467/m.2427 type:complete len:447 (+) Transcript_2467:46-1386(+)